VSLVAARWEAIEGGDGTMATFTEWMRRRETRMTLLALGAVLAWIAPTAAKAAKVLVPFATVNSDAPVAGWDPADPANIEDLREFMAAHWDGLWVNDPGTVQYLYSHGVQSLFRNRLPTVFHTVYVPYFEVFGRIYAHRLHLSGSTDQQFGLIELMALDLEVREQLKSFILTGKLESELTFDSAAFLAHYLLVVDATSGVEGITVADSEFDGSVLVSDGLQVDSFEVAPPSNECPDLADADPASLSACACRLQWLARASPLACMKRNGLWQADPYDNGDPVPPGGGCQGGAFDCDDFTDAMIRWLKANGMQDCGGNGNAPEFWRLPILWRCGEGGEIHGHWVPVVVMDGKRYVVDPYTGQVYGPFGGSPTDRERMKKCGYETIKGGPTYCTDQSGPYVPTPTIPYWLRLSNPAADKDYLWLEPRPLWWNCPESVARFCERLGQCCRTTPLLAAPTNCPPPVGLGVSDAQIRARACSMLEDFNHSFGGCEFPCPDCQTLPPPGH